MATGFPSQIPNPIQTYDWRFRKMTESQGFMGANTVVERTVQITSDNQLTGFTANSSKMSYVHSVRVSCWNKGLRFYVIAGQALYAGANQIFRGAIPLGGGSVELLIDLWLFEGQQLNVYAVWPFPEAIDATTNKYQIEVTIHTDMYTQDIYPDASKVVLALGDSVTAGNLTTPVPSTHKNYDVFSYQLVEYMRSRGESVRLVNWGLPGGYSWQAKDNMLAGRYNVREPSLITWNFGINDAAISWDSNIQATFESAVRTTIAWRDSHYPKVRLMFQGNTPLGDAKDGRCDNFRNYLDQYIPSLGPQEKTRLFYCNLGDSFPRLDTIYFTDSVTHPNIKGNQAVFGKLKTYLEDPQNASFWNR